jgi:hypothetical protein
MSAPLWTKTLVHLPNWMAMSWMIGWGSLSYIFAPYGMWKHHRNLTQKSHLPKEP